MDKIQLVYKYKRLLSTGEARANRQQNGSPILPPPDVNLNPLLSDLVTDEYVSELFPDGPISWHQRMVTEMMGQPKLSLLNCACIIYARRNPTNPDLALDLLRRIWGEHYEVVSEILSLRWIVATLQVFALCSQVPEEKTIGYVGITYGSLIKTYETERLIQNRKANEVYASGHPKIQPNDQRGLGVFNVGNQDIAKNLHSDLFYLAFQNECVGTMLLALMHRIAESDTVFSRLDSHRAKIAKPDEKPRNFCFGFAPE